MHYLTLTLKFFGGTILAYYMYCFTRGIVFSIMNGRGPNDEEARRIATFRG